MPHTGRANKQYLESVGSFLGRRFRQDRISTDQISGIIVTASDPEEIHAFVKQAVQLAHLVPSRLDGTPAGALHVEGTFHLAFVFAPLFHYLPRRDKALRIHSMLKRPIAVGQIHEGQKSIYDEKI